MKKVALITQARVGSSRFKNKVLYHLTSKDSLLSIHLERILKSKSINFFYVATTNEEGVDLIESVAKISSFNVYKYSGEINDVLSRYFYCSKLFEADFIVRVTSDCPLIDSNLIDRIVDFTIKNDLDYCSNTLIDEYPDGQDIEVFKQQMLVEAHFNAVLQSDREHVTPYIKLNAKKISQFSELKRPGFQKIRMTVDYPEDIKVISDCISNLGKWASWEDYASFINRNSNCYSNQSIIRNIGYLKSIENEK